MATESKGVWGNAEPVPGLNKLNFGEASVVSITCSKSGPCVAGGFYEERTHNHLEGFVVSQK